MGCGDSLIRHHALRTTNQNGAIMAKRKKQSKVRKRKGPTARKARKVSKAAQRTAARGKPKRAPMKKAAPKVKHPVAPVVETVALEEIEQPVAVTEVEETRKAS
jgi:hypothetical protein